LPESGSAHQWRPFNKGGGSEPGRFEAAGKCTELGGKKKNHRKAFKGAREKKNRLYPSLVDPRGSSAYDVGKNGRKKTHPQGANVVGKERKSHLIVKYIVSEDGGEETKNPTCDKGKGATCQNYTGVVQE